MGIRTGQEYRESLRDGRTVYVNGERIKGVTTYPPCHGIIDTMAGLYDLQHNPTHQPLLTYPSRRSIAPKVRQSRPIRKRLCISCVKPSAASLSAVHACSLLWRHSPTSYGWDRSTRASAVRNP